ncbi:MAG: hypothetical protein EOP52_06860 [Sphingobacteriales bacterium]|nr:MAG: hypothetical protein EOP52_06860 [Sphingobacteriales bacterium]
MKKLLPLALISLLAIACKKEDSPSRSELITGSWRLAFDALDSNRNQTLETNERKGFTDPDLTGTTYTFNADGSGAISASGTAPAPFAWNLINGEQQLVLTGASFGSDTSYLYALTSGELIQEYRYRTGYQWRGFRK